ncbi:MAG: hypothetical protein HY563_10395 [Ignavibacteriales bacterium]|nr:hypothetical protein [Ignavibacteriales bacterium]
MNSIRRIHSDSGLILLLLLVLLTRLPLLGPGYGSDPDAWRVAFVSQRLWETGEYSVSRFPGYPLHEILSAPLVAAGGAPASNVGSLLAFCCAVVLWRLWCVQHTSHAVILTAAFAFAPIAWVNSAATMDYVWSLLFLIAAMLAASRSGFIIAGIMMGIAAGFRPSNAILIIVPLLLIPNSGAERVRGIRRIIAGAIITGILAFVPVLTRYGLGGWVSLVMDQVGGINVPPGERVLLWGYRSMYAIGPLVTIAFVVIVTTRHRHILDRVKNGDRPLLASLAGIAVLMAMFFALPAERGYLIPAIPFALIVLDRVIQHRGLVIVTALLLSYAAVNPDVVVHGGKRGVPGFNIREGLVLEDMKKKEAVQRKRSFLSTEPFPDSTVVIVGFASQIWVDNPHFEIDTGVLSDLHSEKERRDWAHIVARRKDKTAFLVSSVLTAEQIRYVRDSGFSLACTDDVLEYAAFVGSFRPDEVAVLETP